MAGFKIEDGDYDLNPFSSDSVYYVSSFELVSPAGAYLGNAIDNGLIAEYLPEDKLDDIDAYLANSYGNDDYNIIHGLIFGGYNPVIQMELNALDRDQYDKCVEAVNEIFVKYGHKEYTFNSICEDYTDRWDEGVMYK